MTSYNIYTMDVYKKGDLKGYADGIICFTYNGNERAHEFLYRFDDAENGQNNTLVTIDYGYEVPQIEDLWNDIEKEIAQRIESMEV